MIRYFFLAFFTAFAYAVAAYAEAPAPAPMAAAEATGPKTLFQLSYVDAESAIGTALSERGAGNKVAASITNRKAGPLFSYEKPISVEIRGLQFDGSASHWSANLMVVADGTVISAMPLAGQFQEMAEVPVLKREVRSGDIIRAVDIELRDFPVTQTRVDTITDISSLIGKSPARVISPARPMRIHEIASPAIIKKNGLVKIRYATAGMEITTSGQAMADGAKGDTIDVRNISSRKVLQATVLDEGTVSISPPSVQTSQLNGAAYAAN